MRTILMGVAMAVLAACASQEATTVTTDTPATASALDPNSEAHLWLEEVEGEQALAWVRAQNERSLAVLENDARFKGYYDAALAISTSKERIPLRLDPQGLRLQFLAGRCARARHLAASGAGRLWRRQGHVGDAARHRRAGGEGRQELGLQGRLVPSARV
jgi:hypothetical protein